MNYQEAIEKVVKLLRLAGNNSNANEAALAASRAQDIIDRYKIESKSIDLAANGHANLQEPIKDFGMDPIDPGARQIATWTWRLFCVLGKLHGVKGYKSRLGGLACVGRPSQVQTVRYFYAWLTREVDLLTAKLCTGNGRTYCNNFRNGVVDTLNQRLNAQRQATAQTMIQEIESGELPTEQKTLAIVRVKSAMTCFEQEQEEVGGWMKSNLHLHGGGTSHRTIGNGNARQAGRVAGQSVRLQPARANIGSGV